MEKIAGEFLKAAETEDGTLRVRYVAGEDGHLGSTVIQASMARKSAIVAKSFLSEQRAREPAYRHTGMEIQAQGDKLLAAYYRREDLSKFFEKRLKPKRITAEWEIEKAARPETRRGNRRRSVIEREDHFPKLIEALKDIHGEGFRGEAVFDEGSKRSKKLVGRFYTAGQLKGIWKRAHEHFKRAH